MSKAYWVWMIRDGARVMPLAPFDTEQEANNWMIAQAPLSAGLTRGVHLDALA